jgi:arylsulfatase A-like enzyme/Tfp pilus assembly protein PilF
MRILQTRNGILLLIVLAGILSVLWFSQGRKPVAEIRNVLLISIDTCRADYFGCYGYSRPTTPHIDAVAEEAFLFENVISPVPMTLPAHTSMLTGAIPPAHGVHDNFNYQVAASQVTLAERMKESGFTTGAIIGAYVLDSEFGLDQGFDSYNDTFEEEHQAQGLISERKGGEVARQAAGWLERHRAERFFCFLHFYDPHQDYDPPEPFASRFPQNRYAGEVAYTDHCVGQVLEKLNALELSDSTLVIITSDHGEMLGEHGEASHQYFIYQSAIKVPLIVKLPGQKKPGRISAISGIIDIVPTICTLVGIDPPGGIQGKDLSPFFTGKHAPDAERQIYCESLTPTKYNANTLLGLVAEPFKYIQTTRPELYDLGKDPGETQNLASAMPKRARLLKERLKEILQETLGGSPETGMALNEEQREKLASLGYVGGAVVEDFDFDQTKHDPKDLIDFHLSTAHLDVLFGLEDYHQAETLCRELLQQRPDYAEGHFKLGLIHSYLKDYAAAAASFKQALSLGLDLFVVQNNLGFALFQLSDFVAAKAHYANALAQRPGNVEVLNRLGLVYHQLEEYDGAINLFNLALERQPDSSDAHKNIADALTEKGNLTAAVEHYTRSLEHNPDSATTYNNLAAALYRQGKTDQALAHCRKSLEVDPNQPENHIRIGDISLKRGKPDEALTQYRRAYALNPESLMVYDRLIKFYFHQENFEQAYRHCERAFRSQS